MAFVDPNVVAYLTALAQLKQQYDLANSQIDAQEQQLAAQRSRQEALANADQTRQLGDLSQQGGVSRQNINNQYEARGLYGSGEAEQALARQRASESQRNAAIQSGTTNQISNIESQLAQQQLQLEQQRAQQRLQFQQRGLLV